MCGWWEAGLRSFLLIPGIFDNTFGEIVTGLRDLRDRAFKAYMKLKFGLAPSYAFLKGILVLRNPVDSYLFYEIMEVLLSK